MTPTHAKEYIILGTEITVTDLHRVAIVNRCVSIERLNAETDAFVASLLDRPRDVLALIKRLLNRCMAADQSLTLDPSRAYQMFDLPQIMDVE